MFIQNVFRILAHAYAVIIMLLCVTGPVAVQSQESEPHIVMENSLVRFEFEPINMGLSAITDVQTGTNHIQPVTTKHELWELTFAHGTQKQSLSSTQIPCTSYNIDNLPDGSKRAVFEWENIDWWREKSVIIVKVTVDLPENSGIASWRIWVNNKSDTWGLWDTTFPKFNGYLHAKEYDVAMPDGNWGKLYKNCSQRLSFNYPTGWNMPMQFLCALNGDSGIYMATHDPHAWKKDFTISPGYEFSIKTYAENMGIPGSDFNSPFPVMVGIYHGGWMKGCKMYREFAVTAPWTSKGKVSQREDMPQALKDIGLWMLVSDYIGTEDGSISEKNKPLIDAQKYFDVPIAAHWYNWHVIKFDNNYPHYLPAKPDIRDQVEDLVSLGMVVMPYINGRIIDTFNDDYDEYLSFTVKDEVNKPYLEIYGSGSGRMAAMCPYTEFWQDKVADVVEQLGDSLGVNAVYIDQIAAARVMFCFDKSHGHPVGGGGWWVDGYREMLKKVQKVAHSDGRNMIVTSECAAEPFMDGIDAFLIWIKRDEREIPMMTAVYSGYSIYFASPAWFQYGDRAWIMVQGRDFLWGTQNGWMGLELMEPEHAKKAAYLKSVGKYRIAGKKFLTYGELVDIIEPENKLETITEKWPDHGGNPRDATLPVIQGTVWKSEDGALGIFLVNYLENKTLIDFSVDPAKYGLDSSEGYIITSIKPEGKNRKETVPQGIIKRNDTLGPWEIRFLEITSK
ncbi:MAG: hypothetical protein JXB48_08345 [Candidatus Latescibacteria bacterium]|nr:hypothetical protein [Candidatus Latescibacterota bacterium]